MSILCYHMSKSDNTYRQLSAKFEDEKSKHYAYGLL